MTDTDSEMSVKEEEEEEEDIDEDPIETPYVPNYEEEFGDVRAFLMYKTLKYRTRTTSKHI